MTLTWPATRPPPSVSTPRSPGGSWISTRLCAETLSGIADPLFPALTRARTVAPAEAGRAVLGALLAPLESNPPRGGQPPGWLLPHQTDAVLRARAVLARFGGVLIADGVGLGKTYIALALAALEHESHGAAVAIVPAALRSEWRRVAAEVGVNLPVLAHGDLVRHCPPLPARCRLLLVDEAHAFRNPRTRRYDGLARAAVGRRVALLTATPYNNAPADLAALVQLFAARDRFREFGVADLGRALRHGEPAAALALGALSVCRTRRLVEARFPDLRGVFPARRLLPPARYDLDGAYGGRLATLLEALAELLGAQGALERGASLMHLSLMRRLESSRAALRRSLRRHRDYLAEVARAAESGVALTRLAYRLAVPRGDSDDAQLVLWPLIQAPGLGSEARREVARCRAAVDRALAVLDACDRDLATTPTSEGAPSRLDAGADPKLLALDALLDGALAGRKVIVFTEFRDTALELLRRLRRHRRVLAVVGDGAWAGYAPVTREEALDAFSPRARGRNGARPLLAADVLVATDVASEGLNLQDGAAVVNYDLPWNPVRVMQRVGRIDRLGSPHAEIAVAHLVPGAGLADLAGVLRRARAKLEDAARAPGAEPDPLAALWWVEEGTLNAERIERESWRRVAPFEARERWRALVADRLRVPGTPVLAAGIADDGGTPEAGVMLALTWPDGRTVPLPFAARPGAPPRRDSEALGALAERALHSQPVPVEPAAFTTLLAEVLPEARRCLAELSAARFGGGATGAGRRAALERLRRLGDDAARRRAETRAVERALALLAHELPEGLDRFVARLVSTPSANGALAQRLLEVLAPALPPTGPALEGSPRLSLVAGIVIAARCQLGVRSEAKSD
jgi:hypothetical protein